MTGEMSGIILLLGIIQETILILRKNKNHLKLLKMYLTLLRLNKMILLLRKS